MPRWPMSHEDLRLLLENIVEKFQRAKRPGESIRDLLSQADEDGALYLPENCNGPTGAEAILYAAEKSSEGIAGLREWLEDIPPLRRQVVTLCDIVETLA